VLIVAQLGRTDLRRLAALGSLLAEAHIDPAGIALIGAALPGATVLYGYQAPPGADGGPRAANRSAEDRDEEDDPVIPEPSRRSRRLRPRLPGGPDRAARWP
jgi:hypothetical protein